MDVHSEIRDSVIVIHVGGEIDGRTAPDLERAVNAVIRDGAAIVLDLREATYLSSAGLRVLLLVYRAAGASRAKVALAGVRREIKAVMSSTGFLKFFTVTDTIEEAMSAVTAA